LLVLLLLLRFMGESGGTVVITALLVIILLMAFLYRAFPGAYKYLNRYIMKNRHSKRGLWALVALEAMNDWYSYLQQLISGRSAFMIVASLLGWISEGFALYFFAKIIGTTYGVEDFATYIGSIFKASGSRILECYSYTGVAVLGTATVIMAAYLLVKHIKNMKTR